MRSATPAERKRSACVEVWKRQRSARVLCERSACEEVAMLERRKEEEQEKRDLIILTVMGNRNLLLGTAL